MGAGVADRGADARARRRTFDVVGCGATLRREHDPIDRIVLLPQALSPAHGAPTDTTRVAPLPRSLRPRWCCQPNARRARRLTGDGAVSDAEDRHHRRRRSRHEGYPSPEAHPPTSTGALARRSCRSLCRRADDGLVSTPRGARNTRVSMTPEIFARSIQFSIRHRRDARNQKRGFESAPSLSRWRIAAPDIFFPLGRPRKLTNTLIENARRSRDALIPTGPQSHRETATTMTGKVTGKVRSMTDPTSRASRPPSGGDLRDDGECIRTGALARESMNFPGAS